MSPNEEQKLWVVFKGMKGEIIAWIETDQEVVLDNDGPSIMVGGLEIQGMHGSIGVQLEAPM